MLLKIIELYKKGFFHIFGSSTINKLFSFLSSFILVRVLSKADYGAYSYALNTFSIFYMLSGIGVHSAVLQLCSEKKTTESEKKDIYSFGTVFCVLTNFLISIIMFIYGRIGNVAISEAKLLIQLLSLLVPLSVVFELFQVFLRYSYENKKFSYFTTINTITVVIGSVIGAIIHGSVGLVLGRIIGYGVSIVIGIAWFNIPLPNRMPNLMPDTKKSLFKIGLITMVNMATGQLLYLIDVYVIGVVIEDSSIIAGYKVATIIPDALLFIPSALMIYYFPLFTQHKGEYEWISKNYNRILFYFGIFNVIIVLVMIAVSKFVFGIAFGKQYLDCTSIFSILMLAYFFSATFRKVTGNVLVTQRKLFINLYIGIFEGVINIILNLVLVKKYGAIGAAYATLCVAAMSSFVGWIYMEVYIRSIHVRKGEGEKYYG